MTMERAHGPYFSLLFIAIHTCPYFRIYEGEHIHNYLGCQSRFLVILTWHVCATEWSHSLAIYFSVMPIPLYAFLRIESVLFHHFDESFNYIESNLATSLI